MSITYTFEVNRISIEPYGQNDIRIEIEVENAQDILEEIGESDIVYYKKDDILDEIGIGDVKDYFDLIEKE
jgi:hypothetical protein